MNDTNNSTTSGTVGQPSVAAATPPTNAVNAMPASVSEAPAAVAPTSVARPPVTSGPVEATPVANVAMGAATEAPQTAQPTPAGMMNSNEGTDTDSGSSAPPVTGM